MEPKSDHPRSSSNEGLVLQAEIEASESLQETETGTDRKLNYRCFKDITIADDISIDHFLLQSILLEIIDYTNQNLKILTILLGFL